MAFSMEALSRAIKEMNAKKVPVTPFWDVKQNDFKTLEFFLMKERKAVRNIQQLFKGIKSVHSVISVYVGEVWTR